MDLSKSYDYFQPEKQDDRIHIIGCGSVGSTVASMLARNLLPQMKPDEDGGTCRLVKCPCGVRLCCFLR